MRFGPRREDIPEYPMRAIREIIINALAHREYQIIGSYVIVKWFTDRMEIGSPGGFPEPITPETIYTAVCGTLHHQAGPSQSEHHEDALRLRIRRRVR
jgi:predicted HTH transcriptional regulator